MKNMKHSWLAIIGLLLFCGMTSKAETLPSAKVSVNELPELAYQVTGPVFQLSHTWKYHDGDDKEFAKADFDDSSWQNIEVGKQTPGSGWRWYRVSFDLPANLENCNLLLDLGAISVYDEVFLNSVQVGRFGNPPPNFVTGASHVHRKYPVAAQHFRSGRNVLAVRVYLGYRGGLYEGPFTLQALTDGAVIGKLGLKTGGADALETLLTASPHLTTFEPGGKLLVAPSLMQLFGADRAGKLTATVLDSKGQTIEQHAIDVSLSSMSWSRSLLEFKMPQQVGDYSCRLAYIVDGKSRWKQELPFHVKTTDLITFAPHVDASLSRFDNQKLPVEISQFTTGHFSPRDVNDKQELFDDLQQTDARGSLTYAAQILESLGAPRLFLSNVRPVPVNANKIGKLHRAAGSMYDGLRDTWIYGSVRPNRAGEIKKLSVKSTSWAKRTYHYEYESNVWMDFSLSAISPAWVASSNVQKMRVFEGIEKHGIGLPTHLAYESNGQIKIVDAKKGIRGSDMSANWVLAWFNGGAGWDEFDTPYLFVLQKRPELVQCFANTALFFSSPEGESVGMIQGMPLYGVTLQRPDQTANWKTALPKDVVERCQYWSRVLVNAPDQVTRTAQVDYEKDQLTVKDAFSYLDISDDWKTPGLKIAPISPVLALAAHAGNIDIAVSKPAQDLHMATLHGPLLAADNTDQMVFRISGMLHYIREMRDVTRPDDVESQQIQVQLNAIVKSGLETELSQHPWAYTTKRDELVPGYQQRSFVNLLLTLPYLKSDLRAQIEKEISQEAEKYFLYGGVPGPELVPKLNPKFQNVPAITTLTNPVTGLQLGNAVSAGRFGIDQPFWTSTNVYMVWLYAEMFDRYDWLKQNYGTLQHYFNNERNSHDWDICASWDSFGGFRVGNGLQEGSGKYGGAVAMARIARKLGDQKTSNEAAYYALMEAVGMQGQVSATDYLNQRRPWSGSNTKRGDIEYAQKLRTHYYAEFNEFAGLSQAVILPENLLNSTGSYILSPFPESMRLYQEIWPTFTDDFYDPKYDKILSNDRRQDTRTSMDIFVYMISHYPQSDEQLFDLRKELDLEWWDKLPDYRGYLDSRGKIGYRNLW